jgi:carbon starvation protein
MGAGMSLWVVVVGSAVLLSVAYRVYGNFLAHQLRLDDSRPTPAQSMRDDVDFAPTPPSALLPQHFSAIAAAGPVVGPILAGTMFGWLPALLWILVGSILIGGVHDMTSLVASIRHRARSIPEVVREHVGRRAYILFFVFVWLTLIYIIVAFTDVTASAFHGVLALDRADASEAISSEDGTPAKVVVSGAGIATSSILYLALPILMGLLVRYTKISMSTATIVFLPLVAWSIWFGQQHPFDLGGMLVLDKVNTQRLWNVIILAYCFVASLAPVWILLQPRGSLGGWFLYAALFAGAVGVTLGGREIKYPAFLGFTSVSAKGEVFQLFPLLFITIACGACSGFHSLIASGTTSKQLRRESDAKLVGYGCMLMEAMVAIVSLSCVMILVKGDPLFGKSPNFLYAGGIGSFLELLGIPLAVGVAFGLMAFTTFVYDTLDVCTRLGRFILQELFGWNSFAGRAVATGITILAPLPFLMWQELAPDGRLNEVWRIFWTLFGASNQLLAALTLIGVTVWLWRTYRQPWVWVVVGLPTVWMYVMSMWALGQSILKGTQSSAKSTEMLVASVASVLFLLGAFLLVEAIIAIARSLTPRGPEPALAGAS